MKFTDKPPWTRRELRRLGEALAAGETGDNEIRLKLDKWARDYLELIKATVGRVSYEAALVTGSVEVRGRQPAQPVVSARLKTEDTIAQKLRRDKRGKLDTMIDLFGARVDLDVMLDTQSLIAGTLKYELLSVGCTEVRIVDRREFPKSGYRAVHLHVKAPAGRFEVQVRTALQAAWANYFEGLADRFGRELRYGDSASDEVVAQTVEMAATIAEHIYTFERECNHAGKDYGSTVALYGIPPQVDFDKVNEAGRQARNFADEFEFRKSSLVAQLRRLRQSLIEAGGG